MSEFDDPGIYRLVLESLQTGVYLVDRDQRIVFWNEGAEKITGYKRHEVVGHLCRENLIKSEKDPRPILSDTSNTLLSALRDGKPAMANVALLHKAGHRISVRLRAVPIRNSHGSVIGAAESFEENPAASDWDRRQTKLAEYGCLDQVTGILNQGMIQSRLRDTLATFSQHFVPFSILCIAVDNLDQLRKSNGMGIVAPVLRVVAQTIENSLRPTDFLGRFGDNEFLAILTECDSSEVPLVGERLRKMVGASHVEWWGNQLDLSASFGAASWLPGDDVESLVRRGEGSLRRSIANGGNCVMLTNA
ncbi:MAG TPA: diguanylate cyclase [Candidatus Acidoferrales bacterium]|nr:diguanylate cyclase [Candidatus Acidoferrales bacterium]